VGVFEGFMVKVGLRVFLILFDINELVVGVFVGHLDDESELEDDPVLLDVMVLVPVTDEVADLLPMADTVDVIDAPVVLEASGLLVNHGLPVDVLEGFILAVFVGDAVLVLEPFIESV
jgi:hypothetical protein